MSENNADWTINTVYDNGDEEQSPERWTAITIDFPISFFLSWHNHLQTLELLIKGQLQLVWVSNSDSG